MAYLNLSYTKVLCDDDDNAVLGLLFQKWQCLVQSGFFNNKAFTRTTVISNSWLSATEESTEQWLQVKDIEKYGMHFCGVVPISDAEKSVKGYRTY